jgi:hypothetical protein
MKRLLLTSIAFFVAACSSASPTIQSGPDAEVSFDGLHRIDNSAFQMAWADPDIDFSRYTKVLPGGAFFEFRAVKKAGRNELTRRPDEAEYWISDDDKKRLEEVVSAIFAEEIANSTRFEVTDAPGPDVLILSGGLHDIVSRVPPEMANRGDIFLRSPGEATLILEITDSLSGETIARAVERRAADGPSGAVSRSSSATTWAEIRRLARGWAVTLRNGLDGLPKE